MEKYKKINEEKLLESFIEMEKSTEPNPYLVSKIINRLEREYALPKDTKRTFALQTIAMAAGVALAIAMGVTIGNNYTQNRQYSNAITVNDSQIENLNIYISEE